MDYGLYKLLVVEDEVLIAETIKFKLMQLGFKLIKLATTKDDARMFIDNWLPDAVLLDIRMDGLDTGLEIGRELKRVCSIPFMYITAHSDVAMAQRILDTGPNGYITKPIRMNEFMVSIQILIDAVEVNRASKVCNPKIKSSFPVAVQDVIYLQACGNYWELFTHKEKIFVRSTFQELMKCLPEIQFIRIHRSYIVNTFSIVSSNYSKLKLINEKELPISRSLSKRERDLIKV